MLIEALIALATIAPFAAWLGWRRGERITYSGNATVVSFTESYTNADKCYAVIMLPGDGSVDLAVVDKQLNNLENIGTQVKVVQKARWLEKPRLDTVTWPAQPVAQADPTKADGLFLALYYIAASAGFGFLTANYGLHQFGYMSSALALILSGMCLTIFKFNNKELVEAPITALGFIPLGRGPVSWSILTLLLTAATVWCFWQPGLQTLLGINLAIAVGMFSGMLLSWSWRTTT